MDNLDNWNHLYAGLRNIRVKAQNSLLLISEIKSAGGASDPVVRQKEVQNSLVRGDVLYKKDIQFIRDSLSKIDELLKIGEIDCYFSDEITNLKTFLDRVESLWPAPGLSTDETLRVLDQTTVELQKVVWHCGLVTIPQRVKQHLAQLRVGNALNFEREFSDELPDSKERTELLIYLSSHPQEISGVVDVEKGVIYKASANPGQRLLSFLRIGIFVVALGILAGLIPRVIVWIPDWPFPAGSGKSLAIAYAFVILGGLAHVLIEALKQKQKGQSSFSAIDDWILWVHVREVSIFVGIVSLALVFFVFAYYRKGAFAWQTAFFAGYSVDSFMELFLQRFDKVVSKQTDLLKQSLSETSEKK